MTGRIALITGASEGIGAELARIFAANGHRVALVARREEKLRELAAALVAAGAPLPLVIACDLGDPRAGDMIASALRAADVEPDYVVNNAGFGLFGEATELSLAAQLDMIAVNIRALTDLSLRFSESSAPPSRRRVECRICRRLPARSAHGGLLRHQGLCAVVLRGALIRSCVPPACG